MGDELKTSLRSGELLTKGGNEVKDIGCLSHMLQEFQRSRDTDLAYSTQTENDSEGSQYSTMIYQREMQKAKTIPSITKRKEGIIEIVQNHVEGKQDAILLSHLHLKEWRQTFKQLYKKLTTPTHEKKTSSL